MDEPEVSLDTLLAYLGSEYVHRRQLEAQIEGLKATIKMITNVAPILTEDGRPEE